MNDTLTEIRRGIGAAPGGNLGAMLWWELSGNRITHTDLIAKAQALGVLAKYLPRENKPASAFRKAWRVCAPKRPAGQLLRLIDDNQDEIIIGLVREKADKAAKGLDYDLLERIIYSKKHETIRGETLIGGAGSALEDVQGQWRLELDHGTDDVRTIPTRFLGEAGIALRTTGGIYFVPEAYRTQMEAVCALLEDVGANRTYVVDVPDSARSRTTIAACTVPGLEEEIRQLEASLAKFDPESIRATTLEDKVQEFDGMRARVQLFAGVLNFKAEGLTAKLDELQVAFAKAMAGDSTVPKAEKAKPVKPEKEKPAWERSSDSFLATLGATPEVPAADPEAGF
jgi:hypothetical protein